MQQTAKIRRPSELVISEAAGLVTVEVPWAEAHRWKKYFRDRGIPSTLVLDPGTHQAYLDLCTHLSNQSVEELLDRSES